MNECRSKVEYISTLRSSLKLRETYSATANGTAWLLLIVVFVSDPPPIYILL